MALKVSSEQALLLYHRIRENSLMNEKDFRLLKIRCYICNTLGHIAVDCKQFPRFKGNLIRYFKRIFKKSIESESDAEKLHKNPAATLESLENYTKVLSKGSPKKRSNLK